MASSSSSSSWLPMTGRYSVSVGTSLTRSLKARKAGTTAKPSKLPEKDFFSFRYNFRPNSVDSTRPGVVEVQKGKEVTKITVERPNIHPNEGSHVFTGDEKPAKEVDCVLIWDEESMTFTLEKLDSIITLNNYSKNQPGRGSRLSPPGSASHTSPPSTSTPPTQPPALASSSRNHKPPVQKKTTVDEDLEKELGLLLDDNDDAEGDPDPEALLDEYLAMTKAKEPANPPAKASSSRPVASSSRQTRREEEEESEPDRPLAQTTQPSRPRKPPLLTADTIKASARGKNNSNHASLPPKPQPAPPPSQPPARAPAKSAKPAGTKRERPPAQEDLPKPSPPKRQKAAASQAKKVPPPKPKEDFVLELPGSNSMPNLLPAPISAQPPAPIPAPALEPQLSATLDSDEEDWDDVMVPVPVPDTTAALPPPTLGRMIEFEEIEELEPVTIPTYLEEPSDPVFEEEDFVDALEADLQKELFNMEEEADPVPTDPPLGEDDNMWGESDDYSSSEDSEDD